MTNELKPWLSEDGGDPTLRELLESAEVDAPSERQLERLTAKVAFLFDLPPGGGGSGGDGGGGGPSAPDPTSGSGAGASGAGAAGGVGGTVGATGLGVGVKAFIAASVLGAAGVGLYATQTNSKRDEPVPPVAAPPPSVVAKEEPPPIPPEEPVNVPPPPPKPTVVVKKPSPPPEEPKAKPPPPPTATSDEELQGLDDAMSAARAGRAKDALAAVEAHAAKFPESSLSQEREVIAIEALVTLGRPDEARARLARFRAKWPTSSHLVRLDALLP